MQYRGLGMTYTGSDVVLKPKMPMAIDQDPYYPSPWISDITPSPPQAGPVQAQPPPQTAITTQQQFSWLPWLIGAGIFWVLLNEK